MKKLFIKKDLNQLIFDAQDSNADVHGGPVLKRTLGAFNLTTLGIGVIIGAGIFSLTGTAAANYAGPGIVYSFIIGGVLCLLAGLCYSELAAMVPVSGSAYSYTYATMGEFIAWIIGWDLVLEYAFGAVTVATSWSGYFVSLLSKTLGISFPDFVFQLTKGPWEMATLPSGVQLPGIWNVPATFISLIMAAVLYRGMKESAFVNNLIVVVKIVIIVAFIILGWSVIDSANWIANPSASGLSSLVPAFGPSLRGGVEFMSYGWSGVLTGAGVVFFSYIGFDAVSTAAQEAKNPQKDLPIGILCSLFICTTLYILMALVLTGVVPYKELGVSDPIAVGVDHIVSLHGWSIGAQKTLAFLVKFGALAGLTSVVMVMMMGNTRVLYAMSKDGLLPWFSKVHPQFQTPSSATTITGVFVGLCAGLMPMSLVGELVSIGTLLAFVLVCLGVPILRITNPNTPRPFKTPFYWPVSILGALACMWVMSGLPSDTWIRLFVWLAIGFIIYFTYSVKHSKLRDRS